MNKTFARLSAGAAAIASMGAAHADTTAFTAAVTTVLADIAVYGLALVGIAVAGVGFSIGVKYVKKIRSAA